MRIDENKALFWGIGMLAVGGLITLSTHISAAPGDSYLVTTGLLLVGGLNLVRGLYFQFKPDSRA
ncbi:hypothetical protein BH23ACT4_BH23ACT4_00250 [soil metagenome]